MRDWVVKQDPVEARSNVGKRLEFINGELSRLDSRLKALEKQAVERQQKVRPGRSDPDAVSGVAHRKIPAFSQGATFPGHRGWWLKNVELHALSASG